MANNVKQSPGARGGNRQQFITLLKPSWASGLAVVGASVAAVIGVAGANFYSNQGVQKLFNLHSLSSGSSVSTTSQALNNNFSSNTLVSDIPLFIFWAGVGVIVYPLAIRLFSALRNVADLEAEMTYVNVNRRTLLKSAAQGFVLRAVALLILFAFLSFTIHGVLPLAFSLTRVAANHHGLAVSIGYPVLAGGILIAALHLNIILLRALFMRPRLFGQDKYI